jgi:hypothetical protein
MNRQKWMSAAAVLAVMFLAACGSTNGGLGDIFGGGSSSSSELRGTVDYIDTSARYVVLTNVSGNRSMLSSGGDTTRVYFDNNTTVEYQGQTYRVADLERGDEVQVRVSESGNQLMADRFTVLRDVSAGGSTSGSLYGSNIRGTVRYVDTSRRTIEVQSSSGQIVTVDYDTNTYVTFSGRNYMPADLERGDEIDIRVRDLGNGRWLAQDISVLRSVSTGGTLNQSGSTIRGTVRNVDTSRRTIELEQASWTSGFATGGSTGSRTFIISYDNNVGVDVNGQLHQVQGLERGDIVDVTVQNPNATTLWATRIVLVRDVSR